MNKAILIGNLGQDPELRYTQAGQALMRLRLATSESYVNRDNERQQRTEWHTIVVWGKRAEGLNKILAKGRSIAVEGRIQTRSWEDRDGNKRYTTEINAQNIVLLGGGRGGGGGDFDAPPPGEDEQGGGGDQFGDDDIPF